MNREGLTSLRQEDLHRINRILHSFVAEAGARCALLLDRNGRPLTVYGETADLDATSFATLAAADFDASDQLAELLGESEFTALYHQGVNGSMYLSEVAGVAILAAVFDRRTTLGMVRLKTRQVLPQLFQVLAELTGRGPGEPGLGAGWTSEAVDEIDRLFAG